MKKLSPYTMNKIWGKPCPNYNGGCPCCIAYALNGTGINPTEATVYMVARRGEEDATIEQIREWVEELSHG